ncbi:MAG: peptidoglycan-associated lipoprotein Pal [Desulfobacterales bacterium]|nr:peptidoglycan-associated lipoprotein Pal [Desulfobacterales bacterium]
MRKNSWMCLALLLVIPTLLFNISCSCGKKTVISEPSLIQGADDEAARLDAENAQKEALAKEAELARRRAIEEQRLQEQLAEEEAAGRKIMAARSLFEKEDIHFEFDKSTLMPSEQEILRRKAQWLRNNTDAKVIIEGHCDERGTNEYNLALGDRRSESAKAFLVDLGIATSRLTTVSYGEERPLDPAHNEEAWAKNRRASFIVE